ncbi:MAG TPA: MarR family transcriptional regulator [Roseiarcus sp.]|nr:MarR family transcriptional regulator [Roseiarcus sp.]
MSSANKAAALIPLIVADLFELAGAFRETGEAIARTTGQTQARWQVLSAASAERKTVPQIARRLGVARQGVQRLANLLVADGSAVFEPNPDHRASPHLVLTESGRADLARLTKAAAAYHAAIARRMTGDDLAALRAGLKRLIEAAEQAAARSSREQ